MIDKRSSFASDVAVTLRDLAGRTFLIVSRPGSTVYVRYAISADFRNLAEGSVLAVGLRGVRSPPR